jgi:YVTN family beta-propeller protein
MAELLTRLLAHEAKTASLEAEVHRLRAAQTRRRAPLPGGTLLRRLGRPLLAACLLALTLGSNAFASIPSGAGTFSGCYRSVGGMNPLYVLDTAQQSACPAGMSLTTWSQTGPQGPKGDIGPQGPAGPNVDATTSTIGSVLLDAPHSGGGDPVAFTRDSVIPIANGGTGSAGKNFVDLSSGQSIGGSKTFTGCLQVGSSGCPAPFSVGSTQNYLGQFSSPNAIGTWLGLANSSTGGKEWDLISSGSGNSEGAGQLLFHDSAGHTSLLLSTSALTMTGTIHATAGGFEFPDGTVQSTAGLIYNPLQVALLRWYGANTAGNTVTVGAHPEGVACDGANLWVTNSGSNNVSEVRASDGTVLRTVTVGTNPEGVAFDGANIWVANNGSNTVSEIPVSTGTVLRTVPVGSGPVSVAFDGANIWVTDEADGSLSKVQPSTGTESEFGISATTAAVAFDGANLWVTDEFAGTVHEVHPSTGGQLRTVTVGTHPEGVAFDGANLWVTNSGSNNVSEVRASDGAVLRTVTVGTNPQGVAFDGANLWVANNGSNTVSEVQASTGAVLRTVPVGSGPSGVAFDGANIWVTNNGSNSVSKL